MRAAQKPIASASGLPNAAYDDPELFEFERDHLFAKTWAGLEFASALPENAYARPVDFMGLPLLIIRDKGGQIRVFHNVCSHRGMILVTDAGPLRNFVVCPYHSWSYNQQGDLQSTPHIGGVGVNSAPGFSRQGNGLKEIRSAEWMGILFINLSGDAIDFDEFIAPLAERWEAFTGPDAFARLKVADSHGSLELKVKSNWKLAMENYCEAYHLPWVHPGLNTYSPLDQHVNLQVNDYMSGQGSLNYQFLAVEGQSLPKFRAWPEDKNTVGEYISLFPNIMLGLQVDHSFALIAQPKACDQSLEKLQLFYVNDEAVSDAMHNCRKAVLDAWEIVFREDIFAIERMQQGRKSQGFTGGVFSPVMDTASHVFHKWVAKRYEDALS
ncbi:MAG: aromatic ring-hydroxylating dioxygenase subunit alpha [Gammaproteobacteria bacterium]|nr:aromatic ring-hydroxylating dioxygenase subunit alpha [Gammaproteobacteria bacterium]